MTTPPAGDAPASPAPVRRPIWIRLLAGAVDLLLATILALLLQATTGQFLAARAATMLHVGQPSTVWTGSIPLVLGAVSHFTYGYAFAYLLVVLPEGWSGTSPGKLLFRATIADIEGRPAATGVRWRRLLWKTGGAWIFLLALLTGWWPLAVLACVVGAAMALGTLAAGAPSRQPLHDRLARTTVVRAG